VGKGGVALEHHRHIPLGGPQLAQRPLCRVDPAAGEALQAGQRCSAQDHGRFNPERRGMPNGSGSRGRRPRAAQGPRKMGGKGEPTSAIACRSPLVGLTSSPWGVVLPSGGRRGGRRSSPAPSPKPSCVNPHQGTLSRPQPARIARNVAPLPKRGSLTRHDAHAWLDQ
jgi:hypothetical protein